MDNNINLSVSEEVISTIVEKTVMSVPGVYDIPGGIIDGITNILGSKKTRGIKVEINDRDKIGKGSNYGKRDSSIFIYRIYG